MSRITACFETLRAQKRAALIPFITAGDPDPHVTVPIMHAMVAAGANLIELGVPFSDPMADGPVIQKASERALAHHVSLRDVMAMVAEFRRQDDLTPVVLMGYLNPIEVMGYQTFATAAAAAGVDGVLTVDMPPEESEPLVAVMRTAQLDPIFLLAPNTGEARIEQICQQAGGFIYYVAVKGITGSAQLDTTEVAERIALIKSKTSLPVGVGFGIKDGTSAAAVAAVTDAVVVGSALVSRLDAASANSESLPQIAADFITELRQAMDQC